MPLVRVFIAHTRGIRTGPLRSPEHRMIIFRLDRERIRPVALHLVAQCPDHLRMASIATLADVDVTTCDFERRKNPHARRVLDGLMDREQRDTLDSAADTGH